MDHHAEGMHGIVTKGVLEPEVPEPGKRGTPKARLVQTEQVASRPDRQWVAKAWQLARVQQRMQ